MRLRLIALLSCALAVVFTLTAVACPALAQPGIAPPGLTTEGVTFSSHGLTLPGTVLAPRSVNTRRPAMVLVHGSGQGVSREKLRREAEAFAAGGVITLIYDKRAAGYSVSHRDFSLLADDALAAVALLRTRTDVDPTKVGLWGFSEGGWVAPIAAARSSDVAFLVVVGANGITPARQQAWSLGEWQRHQRISSPGEGAFPTTVTRLLVGAGLFAQAEHDPVPVLEGVRQPVLGIWGSMDRKTPPGEGLTIFRQALAHAGNQHYTLRVFPGGDHAIHKSTDDGFHRLDELMPGYADMVTSWVADVAAGHPPATSADAPPHQDWTSPVFGRLAWWESPLLQLTTVALFALAFLAYPASAVAGRLRRGRRPLVNVAPARWLAGSGVAALLGFFGYFALVSGGASLGPVIAGRALPWLLLQLLAAAVAAAAIATAVAWNKTRATVTGANRLRLGLLLAGAAAFVAWAVYWRLLLP